MKLSGENLGELRAITVDAVVSESELARFLSDRMSLRLDEIVEPDNLVGVVFQLLKWLETRGRTVEFIDALAKDRPNLTESLAVLRDVATAPPKGLEKLKADAGWLGGWLGSHRWPLAAGSIVLVLAAVAVVGVMRSPQLPPPSAPSLPAPSQPIVRPNSSPPVIRPTPPPPVPRPSPQPTVASEPGEPLPVLHAPQIWKDAVIVRGDWMAYASPDTVYVVLKERIEKAKNSIQIAMYEFTSQEVKAWILAAVERKVQVTLLLGSRSSVDPDPNFVADLEKKGVEVIEASRRRDGVFSFYHPKLIVIDESWVLVQTGNLTENSVPSPQASSGNRDMGIAIESPELAKYFTNLIASDKKILQAAVSDQGDGQGDTERKYPASEPVKRFPILRR